MTCMKAAPPSDPAGPAAPPVVTLEITGRDRTLNGADQVPVGLFGVHATPMDPAMIADLGIEAVRVIDWDPQGKVRIPGQPPHQKHQGLKLIVDCWFDRFQPALQLTDPDHWKNRLEKLGATFAQNAAAAGGTHYVEFWNEPYLNWAFKPGANYDYAFYNVAQAAEGAPVSRAGSTTPIPGLQWYRGLRAYEVDTGKPASMLAWSRAPQPPKPDTIYTFASRKYQLKPAWLVRDTEQRHYWSGPYNRALYLEMLLPVAKAIKQHNPQVNVIAGWGFNLFNEDWSVWRELIQPTIDAAIPYIDGINEHHYGGDTRLVAASYEVAVGYCHTRHGKRIGMFNTEAGGFLDPEKPDTVLSWSNADPLNRQFQSMTYTLRDITYLVAVCPDKAITRFAHEIHTNAGDQTALRLLKNLRGTLMEARSDDPRTWAAVSRRNDVICIAAFNDHPTPRDFHFKLQAPASTTFRKLTLLQAVADPPNQRWVVREQEHPAAGTRAEPSFTVPGKSAVVLRMQLDAAVAHNAALHLVQHYAPTIMQSIKAGQSGAFTIAVDPLPAATEPVAWLRLALSRKLTAGDKLTLNGQELPAPATECVVDIPVPRSLIAAENRLTCAAGNAPLQIWSCSLLLPVTSRP